MNWFWSLIKLGYFVTIICTFEFDNITKKNEAKLYIYTKLYIYSKYCKNIVFMHAVSSV